MTCFSNLQAAGEIQLIVNFSLNGVIIQGDDNVVAAEFPALTSVTGTIAIQQYHALTATPVFPALNYVLGSLLIQASRRKFHSDSSRKMQRCGWSQVFLL